MKHWLVTRLAAAIAPCLIVCVVGAAAQAATVGNFSYGQLQSTLVGASGCGTSRPVNREHSKPSAAVDSIRFEVRIIHGENSRQTFSLREVHDSGVREIHWRVCMLFHQFGGGEDLQWFA